MFIIADILFAYCAFMYTVCNSRLSRLKSLSSEIDNPTHIQRVNDNRNIASQVFRYIIYFLRDLYVKPKP
uniref:Uncharacterized protein n=1 Tax=Pararge aegeria TaxID=116150 RepID=S4PR65_9NEOP